MRRRSGPYESVSTVEALHASCQDGVDGFSAGRAAKPRMNGKESVRLRFRRTGTGRVICRKPNTSTRHGADSGRFSPGPNLACPENQNVAWTLAPHADARDQDPGPHGPPSNRGDARAQPALGVPDCLGARGAAVDRVRISAGASTSGTRQRAAGRKVGVLPVGRRRDGGCSSFDSRCSWCRRTRRS